MPKLIMHVDFNSFFASVEQQANPFLRGKPIGITGKRGAKDMARSIIATASIEAKALGVKPPMSAIEAKRICPELILLPGDMRKYSEITKRMLAVLHAHTDSVEQFSTDEAFADITDTAQDIFGAGFVTQIIRNHILTTCGERCTVSIGVGKNKIIAKLASGSQKPNGLVLIAPEQTQSFLASQSLSDVCGIGPATAQQLEASGISSFKTLKRAPKHILIEKFGLVRGTWLSELGHGNADDIVDEHEQAPKSVGHSYTFPYDLLTPVEWQTNLLGLCDSVAYRLRRDGLSAKRVHLYVRYKDFTGHHARTMLEAPVQDGLTLYKCAYILLEKVREPHKPIRLLGVSTSALTTQKPPEQLFQKPNNMNRALKACDHIAHTFGTEAITRAATLHTRFQERASGWHYDHEM